MKKLAMLVALAFALSLAPLAMAADSGAAGQTTMGEKAPAKAKKAKKTTKATKAKKTKKAADKPASN
ncbi:MAG: hypothetical protein LDL07_06560 [Desulfarculus sp.]|nr:hypothetical protein [Desulfarculus sp.]